MIDNNAVRQALGTLERFAPAEDEVLAGMRTGIARRRRRRQVASVVGVAGAAGVVALGVVVVAPGRGGEDRSGFAGAAPTTSVKIATPPAAPVLPFAVGWIPDGYHLDAWSTGPTESSAQYVGSTKDFQTVVVWISAQPRDPAASGDTEEPTTIAGRAGVLRRLAPDRKETQLIWQLADGRWAMVGGRAPTVPLTALQRVAESLSATSTAMPAPFSLTTMPDGYQVANWSGGSGGGPRGSLTLCRSASDARTGALPADCISVSTGTGTAPAATFKPGTGSMKVSAANEVPIDQEKTVEGVLTRATADGTTAVAQLDAEHWAQAFSQQAGVDLLRQVVAATRS